jgi:hypothetical protein
MPDSNEEILVLLQQVKPGDVDPKGFIEALAAKINELINTDFEKLVQQLYRVDVNESKLKKLLRENAGADAGRLIALLLIERQQQKLQSKKDSPPVDPNEELW